MARATDYRLTGHRSQVIHRVGCRVLAKALGRLAVRRRQDARADQRRPRPDDRPAPLLPGLLPRREDPGVAGAALREARLWAPPLEPRPRPRPPLLPERPARERPMSLFAALFALLYVGHLLGDYIVQTDAMASLKTAGATYPPGHLAESLPVPLGRSWLQNQRHVASYSLTIAVTVLTAGAPAHGSDRLPDVPRQRRRPARRPDPPPADPAALGRLPRPLTCEGGDSDGPARAGRPGAWRPRHRRLGAPASRGRDHDRSRRLTQPPGTARNFGVRLPPALRSTTDAKKHRAMTTALALFTVAGLLLLIADAALGRPDRLARHATAGERLAARVTPGRGGADGGRRGGAAAVRPRAARQGHRRGPGHAGRTAPRGGAGRLTWDERNRDDPTRSALPEAERRRRCRQGRVGGWPGRDHRLLRPACQRDRRPAPR